MGKHAFVLLAIIGVVLASCSKDSSEDEISETVEPQISSNAPISLTDEATSSTGSLPETDAEFEVTFDGSDCWVDGPHEVPVGDHTFNFINTSDFMGELWLVFLHEDKTFQDHIDLQSEPGVWYPKPAWVSYDSRVFTDLLETSGSDVKTTTWKLDRVGEHTILCYVPSPQKLWFAAPVFVVGAPSE